MEITCYFDYTCGYLYRGWLWLERLRAAGEELDITWASFVLKEVNRGDDEPSALAGPTIESVAVMALACGEALRDTDGWERYHEAAFTAMHAGPTRATIDDVAAIAGDCGLDAESFADQQQTWLEVVRRSHFDAIERWGVFGTPTVILEPDDAVYLKLAELPAEDDRRLWDALTRITVSYPEILELKRAQAADPG